jgi:patatin-like phospholipase/acyl hydrolase
MDNPSRCRNGRLNGARVWLSGSVPEDEGTTCEQRSAIIEVVRMLARIVFQRGGHIVHGSHPSITPVLLEEAKEYQRQGGNRDALILVVSRLWSKDIKKVPLDLWREVALVYETPEATGENAREESLAILRQWMASRSDAVVVIGGKWWNAVADVAGIPREMNLAINMGLPCFILGGFGGVTESYIKKFADTLAQLKNGLTLEENHLLATLKNVGSVAEQVCDQLERLPLVRGKGTDGVSFRILSLDGGGLKGAFTAAVLASWEEITGRRIVDHFDLITGTSTGGILAIGLGMGLSGKQMLQFYKEKGSTIFPVTSLKDNCWHKFRHLCWPKYSQGVLLKELRAAYGFNGATPLLKDSVCRLVVPAYHAVAGALHVFRTPHHSDLTADANTEAAQVALATAAAPTYFTAARIENMITESSYFDGGVWANTPAMAAVLEAVCYLHVPLERIDVLSVGTTEEPFTVRKQVKAGLAGWVHKKKILELLMNVQQEASIKLTRQLVGEPRFMRVNSTTEKGAYHLDSPQEIGELADLGYKNALEIDILGQVKSRFLNGVKVTPWDKFK